ncbi:MAG TPA: helix-turn-helix domain-containing protein [Kofleriaceae bacterium]
MSLAVFLKTGRASKNYSLADVAKITKIQPRILERLEAGKLEGLPADVFVRGFVRSYAKCCGLDESEALARYGAAMGQPTSMPVVAVSGTARALVESMSELAPVTASVMVVPRATGVHPVVKQPAILVEEMPALAVIPESSMQMVTADIAIDIDLDEHAVPERISAVDVAVAAVEAPAIEPVGEAAPVVETAAVETTGKKKRNRRVKGTQAPKNSARSARKATGTPSSPTPVVVDVAPILETLPTAEDASHAIVVDSSAVETAADELFGTPLDVSHEYNLADPSFAASEAFIAATVRPVDDTSTAPSVSMTDVAMESMVDAAVDTMTSTDVATASAIEEPVITQPWAPRMPVISTTSAPWRRPALGIYGRTTTAPVPSMVIDDADPDSAERELEERAMEKEPRTSFLPPILRDRAKNGNGQGTLTLAVLILLIAATLTLSYLMRRPSSSGDGVTRADAASQLVG